MNRKILIIAVVLVSIFGIFHFTSALDYQLLAPLPLGTNDGNTVPTADVTTYIPLLVKLAIGVATALAVLQIIIGGIQYMSTDAFSGKNDARNTINNALIGLLLAMSSWVILNTINPNLLQFNFELEKLPAGTGIDTNIAVGGATCALCNPVQPDIPHKPVGQGCLDPGPCYIETILSLKLRDLASTTKPECPDVNNCWWQVTEMYPPVVEHDSDCHKATPKAGMCVDISIRNTSAADMPGRVIELSELMREYVNDSAGNFKWEVKTQAEKDSWDQRIEDWAKAHPNYQFSQYWQYARGRIFVNPSLTCQGATTCTFHVHLNSPTLTNGGI